MSPELKHAVRAFNRLWRPISEQLDDAAAADAGYDGGEWSGGWHAEKWEAEHWNLIGSVATKFGLPVEELDNAIQEAGHHENDCFMEAVQ